MIHGSNPFVKLSIVLLFLGFAAALLVFIDMSKIFSPRTVSPVEAEAPSDEVVGWAWSGEGTDSSGDAAGGAGWVSFNSRDCDTNDNHIMDAADDAPAGCPPNGTPIPDYAVRIPQENDPDWPMVGYAWVGGDNDDGVIGTVGGVGWIRFDPANTSTDAPNTPGNTRIPTTVNILTGKVMGWARACSVFVNNCSGALKPAGERGNWDGWISMAGQDTNGSPYGIVADIGMGATHGNFSGYAWGGGDSGGDPFGMGWVDFRPSNGFGGIDYEGQFNQPPVCDDNNTDYYAHEDADYKTFQIIANGDCTDPDGDPVTIEAIVSTNPVLILPGNACVTVNGNNCVASGPSIRFRPNPNFIGLQSITYRANDGRGLTDTATITFPVYDCGNDALEGDEQCDLNQFGGQTCRNQGRRFNFIGGDLTCTNDQDSTTENCKIHTDQCKKFRDVEIKED